MIIKRLKLWPALGLIGARQVGKSTLLREIIGKEVPLAYYTMDSKAARGRAERAPDSFVEMEAGKVKVIDEIQKVPDLFDAVKFHIDQARRPGSYILSGSTEFSQFTGIRESLTGRIGILELFPFNLSEIFGKSFGGYWTKKSRASALIPQNDFNRKLSQGGMPGFFHLRDAVEYDAAAQLWVETTCYRDLSRVLKKDFDGELALSILTEVAQAETPSAAEIAKKLRKDSRVINRYLEGFMRILVLKRIQPHAVGTGKPLYYLLDSGLCRYLGGSETNSLRTHVLTEALSYFECHAIPRPLLTYYHSTKDSYVPFVFEWKNKRRMIAVQISDSENPGRGEIAALTSFSKKLKTVDGDHRFLLLSPVLETAFEKEFELQPLRG
jgi:predicted AAA+ superfamily ATPase